jgi:hypothetical protein
MKDKSTKPITKMQPSRLRHTKEFILILYDDIRGIDFLHHRVLIQRIAL